MALSRRAIPAAALVAALACGVMTTAAAARSATTCGAPAQPPNLGRDQMNGVTVVSACNAWAVGWRSATGGYKTLAEHWNGQRWRVFPTPNPPGATASVLSGVSAASATDVWAVGDYQGQNGTGTLIEHWNGSSWSLVPGADLPCSGCGGPDSVLLGVSAGSATAAWAVGTYFDGTTTRTLIEHWNGRVWRLVASPSPGGAVGANPVVNTLRSVSRVSASEAWAVGSYDIAYKGATVNQTLILHWNGHAWAQVPSPNAGGPGYPYNDLYAVSARIGNAWAVGWHLYGSAARTLTEHWNGKTWTRIASPTPSGASYPSTLYGVTTISPASAWAVGYWYKANVGERTLMIHWNGQSWKQVTSPNPGGTQNNNRLVAVAGTSCGNLWAVGYYNNDPLTRSITARC